MVQNSQYISKSIPYQLTNWFDEIRVNHREYKIFFDEMLSTCEKEIIPVLTELQKSLGKQKTSSVIKLHKKLQKIVTDFEPEILVLIEFLHTYINTLNKIEQYEFDIKTHEKLEMLLKSDISILEEAIRYLKNIIKASNIIFNTNRKVPKRKEEVFDRYSRDFIRFIRNINKDLVDLLNKSNKLVNDLAIKIENIKLEIVQEKEKSDDA